jgi:hypothetical protein
MDFLLPSPEVWSRSVEFRASSTEYGCILAEGDLMRIRTNAIVVQAR